ncbi:MAG TPA: DUF4136 domain-containing protein [Steroidobacteraceae bacterium]|nr:DUF4136 domain-containing protein [Steroidobacteraceae bacterium]
MRSRFVLATIGATLLAFTSGLCAAAGSGNISFDANTDFGALRTYAFRDGQINTRKPEIDNRLFRQRVNDSIRATLAKKRLQETAGNPDLWVSFHFTDVDFSEVERMGPTRIPGIPGQQRGFVVPGTAPRPVMFTEGTLVIDLYNAANVLVWRGTVSNREQSGPALSRKLSGDAGKLMAKYPPKKK